MMKSRIERKLSQTSKKWQFLYKWGYSKSKKLSPVVSSRKEITGWEALEEADLLDMVPDITKVIKIKT